MSVLRKLMIVPPVAVGIGLVAYAISSREPPAQIAIEESRTPVRILSVEPQPFLPRVSGFGTVAPSRIWNAVAQVSGRINAVNPDFVHGGTVRKGDMLVRIAPDDYELAIAQARSEIESATAEFEQAKLSEQTIQQSLAIERDALQIARRELERQRDLAKRNTVAEATVEAQESAVLAQRARVQELENQLTVLPFQLEALAQSEKVAEASLAIAELNLERTLISAPFDARVAAADVEISQYVGVGTSMGTLDGIESAEIDVQVSPRQMAGFVRLAFGGRELPAGGTAGQVPPGVGFTAEVQVGFPGTGQGWQAEVKRISDTVDPETRSIGVIVSVPEPYGQARPGVRPPLIKGMFTEVELRAPVVQDVFLLPRTVVRDGQVMIADADDRLTFAEVEIAYSLDDIAVLRGGLEPGTRVVVSDPSPAIPGMLLAPTGDPELGARLAASAMPVGAGE